MLFLLSLPPFMKCDFFLQVILYFVFARKYTIDIKIYFLEMEKTGRMNIPIMDEDANITFYLVTKKSCENK